MTDERKRIHIYELKDQTLFLGTYNYLFNVFTGIYI